jgi:hypothetical protein
MGGWPLNRNNYIKIANKLLKFKPSIIHFDMAFINKQTTSDIEFAEKLNKEFSVSSTMINNSINIEVNFQENQKYLGGIINGFEYRGNGYFSEIEGMEFPFEEVTKNSNFVCPSIAELDKKYSITKMIFYYKFKKFVYENCPLSIVNSYLSKQSLAIDLSSDNKSIDLFRFEGKNRIKLKSISSRMEINEEFFLKIDYSDVLLIPAINLLNENIILPEGRIFIIGFTAPGLGDKWLTPNGYYPGSIIVANEVNTILKQVEEFIK